MRSIIEDFRSFFSDLQDRHVDEQDILDRGLKRLDLLSSIASEQGRFWTSDGRRFGFEVVDYFNVDDDVGSIEQLLNRLQNTPIDSVQPGEVLQELDRLLTRLLQNMSRNTWQADEPTRAHVAELVANLRDRFMTTLALDASRPAKPTQPVSAPPSPSMGRQGNKVFVGHGRSSAWRELKDFIQDRLHLTPDEFNRVPVARVATSARLAEMLDDAGIAFLVLTAEDERRDGVLIARQNVVHEAGLFQGRLGFSRAIVLLEEGCEEFSNITGLGHIPFPSGLISAAFEDVRRVLERERFLES
jgi:predicted nucleotide-binding protein